MDTNQRDRFAGRRRRGLGPVRGAALALLLLGPGESKAESGERFAALSPAERLRVTEAGSGRPIVLIPGLFGCAYGYRGLLSELALAGYHGIVVEPLGVGGSSRPEGFDYSLTAQADRVSAVLDALELPPAVTYSSLLDPVPGRVLPSARARASDPGEERAVVIVEASTLYSDYRRFDVVTEETYTPAPSNPD